MDVSTCFSSYMLHAYDLLYFTKIKDNTTQEAALSIRRFANVRINLYRNVGLALEQTLIDIDVEQTLTDTPLEVSGMQYLQTTTKLST